jgi:hypothetical protein
MDTVPSSRFHAGRASHRIPEMGKTLVWAGALIGCAMSLSAAPVAREAIDYAGFYAKGMTFAAFLDAATSHEEDWRKGYSDAAVSADVVSRLRALPARRQLLVVADDYCSDSTATVPYVARLVDAAPDRLALRMVNSRTGRPIMEAHRTSDGRAATPTVVVLSGQGSLIGAWSERPSVLQAWVLEHKPTLPEAEFRERKAKWYADDAGQSAVAEILALIER